MKHELKTDPQPFQAVWEGRKPFEIRFDDRGFKHGDELLLRETKYSGLEMREVTGRYPLEYTGRWIGVMVLYIMRGGYGLKEGWIIMGVGMMGRGITDPR